MCLRICVFYLVNPFVTERARPKYRRLFECKKKYQGRPSGAVVTVLGGWSGARLVEQSLIEGGTVNPLSCHLAKSASKMDPPFPPRDHHCNDDFFLANVLPSINYLIIGQYFHSAQNLLAVSTSPVCPSPIRVIVNIMTGMGDLSKLWKVI